MYEGKPLVLVVGGTDTGRTPMAAALLRRALGPDVVVRTAGVLSHEGEGVSPEAQMALEQVGIDISQHMSRPLRSEEHRNAELLVAVDRGTQLVLVAEFAQDPRVTCLPALASMPDVLDPHRMPLGVWVTALRQLSDQVSAAVPQIRTLLGITDQPPLPLSPQEVEPRTSTTNQEAHVLGTGHKMQWDRDEDMQRLLQLINGEAHAQHASLDATADASGPLEDATADDIGSELTVNPVQPVPAADEQSGESGASIPGWDAHPDIAVSRFEPSDEVPSPVVQQAILGARDEHVARMIKLLRAAEEMPELVDWGRLREELVRRLRAVAGQTAGPSDFTAAAILMIEGKLAQIQPQPNSAAVVMLCQSIKRLETPLSASLLATIADELTRR